MSLQPLPPKRKVGRPSLYKPEMCEQATELMKSGLALEELPLHLKVSLRSINEWREVHPEFAQAIKDGIDYSQSWWMGEGRENIRNKEFNATLWYMNMKNRFGWKDKTENHSTVSVEVKDIQQVRDSYKKDV